MEAEMADRKIEFMIIEMEDIIISSYSVDRSGDVQPDGGDTFDFQPEFTSEPTMAPDVAIYNGFEVVNTTSLSYGDGGFIILG
jgi:hypothetical protein